MTLEQQSDLRIFISHKEQNSGYADVLSQHLKLWGLEGAQIMHTSGPKSQTQGPAIGDELLGFLREFLWECNLVIYIYTHAKLNWEWCNYELGVAEDRNTPARIVILQIFEDEPSVHRDLRRIQLDNDQDILDFVFDFHRMPDFFKGLPGYWQRDDETLRLNANALIEALRDEKEKDRLAEGIEREARWGCFQLGIGGEILEPLHARWDKALTDEREAMQEDRRATLRDNLIVTEREGSGLHHFGLEGEGSRIPIKQRWSVGKLESEWRSIVRVHPQDSWLNELLDEIWSFLVGRARPLRLRGYPSGQPHVCFAPVVTHCDRHTDGSCVFSVAVYTFRDDPPIA